MKNFAWGLAATIGSVAWGQRSAAQNAPHDSVAIAQNMLTLAQQNKDSVVAQFNQVAQRVAISHAAPGVAPWLSDVLHADYQPLMRQMDSLFTAKSPAMITHTYPCPTAGRQPCGSLTLNVNAGGMFVHSTAPERDVTNQTMLLYNTDGMLNPYPLEIGTFSVDDSRAPSAEQHRVDYIATAQDGKPVYQPITAESLLSMPGAMGQTATFEAVRTYRWNGALTRVQATFYDPADPPLRLDSKAGVKLSPRDYDRDPETLATFVNAVGYSVGDEVYRRVVKPFVDAYRTLWP